MTKTLQIGNTTNPPTKTIEIRNNQGQSYWLNLVDGVLTQGGDLPLDEAAKIFFAEVQLQAQSQLKPKQEE